jgi:ribonuclease P protein component
MKQSARSVLVFRPRFTYNPNLEKLAVASGGVSGDNSLKSGRLRRGQRVRDTRDFERVYAGRKKVSTSRIIVCYSPNDLKLARLGVSVGAKHGNAVRRNRIKRVMRAAFRLCAPPLPSGFDYVLIPQATGKEYSTAAMLECLKDAVRKIGKPVG